MNQTVRRRRLPAWYVGLAITIVAIVSIPIVAVAYFAWQIVISGIPALGVVLALIPTIALGWLCLEAGTILVVLPTFYLGSMLSERRP